MSEPLTIGVFGVGNVLLGDDGLGSSVIHELESSYRFPQNVSVEDLGTPGLELLAHVAGFDIVIFVDAVADDFPPGTLRQYDRRAIVEATPALRVGPHDPALGDTILALEFAGNGPREVMLVGVVASTTASGTGLSDPVRAAVPLAADAVLAHLARYGVTAIPLSDGPCQPPWWQMTA